MSLETVVANMLKAGEPEEVIASVVQEYNKEEKKKNGKTKSETTTVDTKDVKDPVTAPQLLFDIGDNTLTLKEVEKLAGDKGVSTYLKENNGKVRLDKDHTLPEVKIIPAYQNTIKRANELFEEELDNIFKVHEGTSVFEVNQKKSSFDFGDEELEISEEEQHLVDHSGNPLTGIENVENPDDPFGPPIGVRRKGINLKGNQAVTSIELKNAATKIWEKIRQEDTYIGGFEEGGFNYKVAKKVKKELNDWALDYQATIDWSDPNAIANYGRAVKDKMDEIWTREAENDEDYQFHDKMISDIINDKFKALIINKGIEEDRSDLIPDNWERAGAFGEGLYKLLNYTLPGSAVNSAVVTNGEKLYHYQQFFNEAEKEGWTDKTKGYIGKTNDGRLIFKVQKGPYAVTAGMTGGKKISWGEAQVMINAKIDEHGYAVMDNLVKSKEYQAKMALLGTQEILDENWDWNMDAEGYKDLLGTQLGQMALGTLSFGGSTFMQELGQMSQELIYQESVLEYFRIPHHKNVADFSEEERNAMFKKFNKLSADEQNKLSMKVLKDGHIPFDSLYKSAARSAGLDLIGNFFVIGKIGSKVVPKGLVNAFMTKHLGKYYAGGVALTGKAVQGTLVEMLTEGLQATNSEATVAVNSPLSNFDFHPVANEAMMAALVPGPIIIAGQGVQSMIQEIRTQNLDMSEGSYEAWFKTAENKVNAALENGDLTRAQHTKAHEDISNAKEILSNTNLKDVKTPEQRGLIIDRLLDSQVHNTKINELQAEIKKIKDKLGPSAKTTSIDNEIAVLQEKVNRNTEFMIQEKTVDHFLINAERQAEWQNRQSEGLNKNRFTKIFKTKEEARKYLLKNYPEQFGKFKNMLEGGYGTNVQMIGPDGEVIAYNFAIEEHVIDGIRKGDLMAGNVINHEQAHDNLSTFSTEELKSIRLNVLEELEASKDPQMQRVLTLMRAKLKSYAKKKGTRNEHEEFFTAMSDAFHALNMMNLSVDGNTTLSFLGEIFSNSFEENIGPIVDWKTGFSEMGVVDFIKSYTKERVIDVDPIADIRDGKEPGIFDDNVKKGNDGIYVQDSRRVYPIGRTTDEIKQANKVLAEEILNEKTNPSYKNETNPALEAKVRAGKLKELEGELVANNMGLINMFLLPQQSGGLYYNASKGNVKHDDFSEAVMGEVATIINSYDETLGDFGMYLGGLMDKRIPGIWDKLVLDAEGQYAPEIPEGTESTDYDDFMNDFEEQVIIIGGKETTKKAATSEMRKRLGIKTGDQMYNEVLDEVIDITIQNFDAINEEGFYQDTKERFQEALFKKIKKHLGSPKSEKFITWLNDEVENLYNLLPQSAFNKSYDQFNEIISIRASVKQSEDKDFEFYKGVKVKSKTAGNRVAVKKPFTKEIGEQFIKNILQPETGRPASKQDALVDQLIEVIAFDAVGTAMESKAFQEAHGDQKAIMGVIADKINRDMTVQFSNSTTGVKYELRDHSDLHKANQLIGSIERSGLVNHDEIEDWVRTLGKNLKIKQDVIEFVVHLDSKEIIEVGDAIKFKSDLIKYLEIKDPDLAAALKADGAIKGNKDVLDKIAEDVTEFTGGLDPEMLDAVGFDIFAFHHRAMSAAETQQGPMRGDGTKANKNNKSYKKRGKGAFINSLLIDGWTFNSNINKFIHNKGKYKPSEDPVNAHGANPTPAPYFNTLQDIKAKNELKKDDPNYSPTGKYDNVRIMNIDYPGGLFKNIGNILNDKTIQTRQARIDKIIKLYGTEIEAANKANTELATDISVKLIEAVKDGSMDAKTLMHVLQSQTNLAFGFRGLTKLSMISVLEGTYKSVGTGTFDKKGNEIGARVFGEHINPNSGKMLELAKIALRAKNDPEYNYREAVAELFSDHEQILYPSTEAKTVDTSKLLSGQTSTASYDRLKALTPAQQKNFIGIKGESYREALANANARKNIEVETAKKKFESERIVKKQKATQNILVGEEKGATVYDFDETLAYSDNVVYAINKKTGEKVELTSDQWKNWRGGEDWNYDFTDFNYVTNGKPGPMIPNLIKTIDKHGVDGVKILTARHHDSAVAMHAFVNGELVKHYKSKGVAMKDIPQIPLENFTGVGNSTGEAKANWIQENLIINNNYNRILFADDAVYNINAVQKMFNQYPSELLEGKTVLVQESLSTDFNKIIQQTEGVKAEAVFSEAQAKIRGAKAGSWYDVVYPASAYDFEMFTYKYLDKGKVGEQQKTFFKTHLFNPFEKAIQQIDTQKQAIRDDYKALVKELPKVRKNLKKNIEGTNYTVEQALRVYIWNKNGVEVPGLSKRDLKTLVKTVEADQELILFADRLSAISQQEAGYVAPSEYWTVEGISYDLTEMTGKVGRAKALGLWKENVSQIFSEENKNKLRAIYGNAHVEALEDMLYRMEYGTNRDKPGRIEQNWNNWVNNSVGAVMFFNMRSATLQTISAFNYVDWKNNNPANAALAFANQPQYWKDFGTIFNSDYLKERRAGNKRTINEAELSAHLKGSTNKAKAALAWLLEKGFTPTQIADSFAIASGGAAFYRNQIKAYEKSGMSTKEAEAQAWMDFRQKTEYGQQSSRPDLISQQQAGGLGRLILAFKNTPMQYNRLMIKAIADLKNKRGSTKENLSKIAYYGAVQNVIFTSLQTALFSALGDEDEWDNKKERVANGMIDSILNGMGLTGAVVATIKNGYIQYSKQKKRGFKGDQTRTLIAFANLSPTIGSKLRKLYGGIRTEQLNKGAIEEMGFTIENPAFNSLAQVISATTNIPLDRAVSKIQNILLASKDETEAADKIALVLGWNPWDLGLETEARKVSVKVKERKKEEAKINKGFEFEEKIKEQEKENLQKQKQEKEEGKKEITCAAVTKSGRCGLPVVPGKTKCTVHQEVEQRKDGKETICTFIKSDGKKCKQPTKAKSGLCYYHD